MSFARIARSLQHNHAALMLLCCIAPIALAVVLLAAWPGESYFVWAIFLLCPILHLSMMKGMHKRNASESQQHSTSQEKEI